MIVDFSSRSHPFPTADVILINSRKEVLLIERKNPPPGFALPGGFVEYGESAESAASRELAEETGIRIPANRLKQFRTFSQPGRDPRLHTLTVVFWAKMDGRNSADASRSLQAGSDAANAAWYPIRKLPKPIAFDHRKIIADFLKSGLLF